MFARVQRLYRVAQSLDSARYFLTVIDFEYNFIIFICCLNFEIIQNRIIGVPLPVYHRRFDKVALFVGLDYNDAVILTQYFKIDIRDKFMIVAGGVCLNLYIVFAGIQLFESAKQFVVSAVIRRYRSIIGVEYLIYGYASADRFRLGKQLGNIFRFLQIGALSNTVFCKSRKSISIEDIGSLPVSHLSSTAITLNATEYGSVSERNALYASPSAAQAVNV